MGLFLTSHGSSDSYPAFVSAPVSLFPLQQASGLVPCVLFTTAIRLIREQLTVLLISKVQKYF